MDIETVEQIRDKVISLKVSAQELNIKTSDQSGFYQGIIAGYDTLLPLLNYYMHPENKCPVYLKYPECSRREDAMDACAKEGVKCPYDESHEPRPEGQGMGR